MKYTIEIPTIEALETLTAVAHRKAQAWMLDKVSNEVESEAEIGGEEYTLELSDCPYKADTFDVNEVQNTLRKMGFMTTYYPRKAELLVEWNPRAQMELQRMKNSDTRWLFTTRAEHKEHEQQMFQSSGFISGRPRKIGA